MEIYFKIIFGIHIFYHILKVKVNLHINEIDMFVYFYIQKSILAEY